MHTLAHSASSDGERLLYRKIALRIVPFLFISYVVAFIDRINIGFAQLQMKGDLGFSDAVYGLGAGIFFLGYFLFEVPSNLLLHRVGARRTFVRIMICWGVVSISMLFVKQAWQLYCMRFLLGVFEAGFFPGIVLYLSYWFPSKRRAEVTSWMFIGVAVAGVVGGILSGAIMAYTDGWQGLRGWQWMFLLEGLPAIALGLLANRIIEDNPREASWLSEDEKGVIIAALEQDEHVKSVQSSSTSMQAFRDLRVYVLALIYFTLVCGTMAISFWLPTVIRETGVNSFLDVGLLSAIPYGVGAAGIFLISRHSDAKGERRLHYLVCTACGGLALFLLAFRSGELPAVLLLLAVAVAFSFSALAIFWTIPQRYLAGAGAASGIAVISSLGQLGSFLSPTLIGWIKTTTGRLDNGLYVLGALMILGGIAMYVLEGLSVRQRKLDGDAAKVI